MVEGGHFNVGKIIFIQDENIKDNLKGCLSIYSTFLTLAHDSSQHDLEPAMKLTITTGLAPSQDQCTGVGPVSRSGAIGLQ